jgi:hypothetical protein
MDRRGIPRLVSSVQQLGGVLAAQPGRSPEIGQKWPCRSIDRYDTFRSQWNHIYN